MKYVEHLTFTWYFHLEIGGDQNRAKRRVNIGFRLIRWQGTWPPCGVMLLDVLNTVCLHVSYDNFNSRFNSRLS